MVVNASVWRGRNPFAQTGIPKGTRGFSIPASAVGSTPLSFSLRALRGRISYANNLIQRTIPRLTRFLGTPHLNARPISLNRLQHRTYQTIQARLNLSTRFLLSRPLKAAGMPRAPTLSRPFQEMGLGTARKFSSHSAFRHVVENTSITTRAFWQADWDVEAKNNQRISTKRTHRKGPSKRRQRASIRQNLLISAPKSVNTPFNTYQDDLDIYFMEPSRPAVTTFLHVALTSTIPSLSSSYQDLRLLPLDVILRRHSGFQDRTRLIEAIFTILDSHDAWSKGVIVEAIGNKDGLASELRITFGGWHEGEVRDLLGSFVDGEGCSLYQDFSAYAPGPESQTSGTNDPMHPPLEFVMPSTANYDPVPSFQVKSPSIGWDFIEFDGSFPSSRATSEWGDTPPSIPLQHHNTRLALSSSFLAHLDELNY
ncbi:hypothetical protein CPB86DRAFT_785458 [Serendipita vermifera]|nr:hypothetical protein CPB86DRAFT_785458 [Serendipita vermifera]